jgi:hypothetical protein
MPELRPPLTFYFAISEASAIKMALCELNEAHSVKRERDIPVPDWPTRKVSGLIAFIFRESVSCQFAGIGETVWPASLN